MTRILITSGPTQEPLDPIRYLTNHSSGKQGYAIAKALADKGNEVILVSGPVHLPRPENVTLHYVQQAQDMFDRCMEILTTPVDVAICAAAVSDWRFKEIHTEKLKKTSDEDTLTLTLVKNPDILTAISQHPTLRPPLVIGFAAETNQVVEHAVAKRRQKGCDWLLANDVSEGVFGSDYNTIYLVNAQGVEPWPRMTKQEVAEMLAEEIRKEVAL